ncbi:MAG TPA: N-acetylmuramoyl-L-alanine amidase [Caproiciproducens sp.]|nr:N-acetylmuramoyl-L-alanine amidase [Caproiciproducens sp.]
MSGRIGTGECAQNSVTATAQPVQNLAFQNGTSIRTIHTGRTTPFKVYLSPSCQPWNPYSDGSGSEEYHMRQIACAMPKYLNYYGIQAFVGAPLKGSRSGQKKNIMERVKQATDNQCNLYLAIHSNARDGGPKTNGTLILYPSKDDRSLRFAQILTQNFMYPNKNDIDFGTKDELWEMYMPKMPHCLIETAYHDNPQDIRWIEQNTEKIAQNLAYCIALYANTVDGASIKNL